MKIINKSIEMAHSIFPSVYENRERYMAVHFSFLWKHSRLISIGNNSYSLSSKALYFANKFNIHDKKLRPFLHSEVDAISKVWGKVHLDRSIKMINIRLNVKGDLCNSKPCSSCDKLLRALNLRVLYSTKEGNMECMI